MTQKTVDSQATIDHVRSLIAYAASYSRTHASDQARLGGNRAFITGYLQSLLTEGVISQEMCNKMIAELDEALDEALKAALDDALKAKSNAVQKLKS